MSTPAMRPADLSPTHQVLGTLITERLRALLEKRALRLAVIGTMLVFAAALRMLSQSIEAFETEWLFLIPVAIAAIAAGLREGLLTAVIASMIDVLYGAVGAENYTLEFMLPVLASRFALYGITSMVLGAFAEAHYAVQHHLRQLASLDPLTKVSNVERFYHELSLLEATGSRYCVMVCDMDNLKVVNDRYGHQVGSAAIQAVANVLRRVTRASDCVARFGGDEFVVILKEADRAGAQIVVNRARTMLAEQRLPGVPELELGVSFGVALSGEDGINAEELLEVADSAMYTDKRARKSSAAAMTTGEPALS